MESEVVKVICPSHKRADRVLTKKIINNLALCVPEAQAEDYKQHNPECEIIEHPDDIIGLPLKRQWIYEQYKNVFMLDDDVDGVVRRYEDSSRPNMEKDPEFIYDLIQTTALNALNAECKMYGFSNIPTPISYVSMHPIKMSGYIGGHATGMLESEHLNWNECEGKAVEDFWISGLNAYHYRKMFIDTRFCFHQRDTFTNRGGLAEFRNLEQEEFDTKWLQRMFGKDVIQRKQNSKMRSLKTQSERRMKLPF